MIKNISKKFIRKNSGITLIALVITIIVLLILAGVSIATLTGNNGILTRAQVAKQETAESALEEKIRLAISEAQMGENEYQELTTDNLGSALIKDGSKAIVSDNEDGTRHILFLDEKKEYRLDNNGNIEDLNIDFNSKYVAPDSQVEEINNGVIGIGTDGKPVNMDLWEYTLLDDGTYCLNDKETLNNEELGGTNSKDVRSKGYKGNYNEDGTIDGSIPQYISTDKGNTFIPVTDMYATFFNDTNLEIAPIIPNTVLSLWNTFSRCTNLENAPNIPQGVITMESTFLNCITLKIAPEIPNSVNNMRTTFYGCSELSSVQNISTSVVNMRYTFSGCAKLKAVPNIPNGAENMFGTFENCTSLEQAPILPDSVTDMHGTFLGCTTLKIAPDIPNGVQDMSSTFENCINLKKAPSLIPESVTDMRRTFKNCYNLSGTIQIDANITGKIIDNEVDCKYCFRLDDITKNQTNIILKGNITTLNLIIDNSTNNTVNIY